METDGGYLLASPRQPRTPRRSRSNSAPRLGSAVRSRRCLGFGASPLGTTLLLGSPDRKSPSPYKTPNKAPSGLVTPLREGLNRLLITPSKGESGRRMRTPRKVVPPSPPVGTPVRSNLGPVDGVAPLKSSPDQGISTKTFYGRSPSLEPLTYQSVKKRVAEELAGRARARLSFDEIIPKTKTKKRSRSSGPSLYGGRKRPRKSGSLKALEPVLGAPDSRRSLPHPKRHKPSSAKRDEAPKADAGSDAPVDAAQNGVEHRRPPVAGSSSAGKAKPKKRSLVADEPPAWAFFSSPGSRLPSSALKKRKLYNARSSDGDFSPGKKSKSEGEANGEANPNPGEAEELAQALFEEDSDDSVSENEFEEIIAVLNSPLKDNPAVGGSEGPGDGGRRPDEGGDMDAEDLENREPGPKFFPIFEPAQRNGIRTPLSGLSPSKASKQQPRGPRPEKRLGLGSDQMQIDAGQKGLVETSCSGCGLVYTRGDPEDEAQHERYHSKRDVLAFKGWKVENVVGRYGPKERIVAVGYSDASAHWKRVEEVIKVMNDDIGEAGVSLARLTAPKAYLYVKSKTIVGCLLAESVEAGYRVRPAVAEGGVVTASDSADRVRAGVHKVWVLGDCRRSGVATRLMDAFRSTYIFAHILKLDEVAFSDPTIEGRKFASRYFKRDDFHVYLPSW